MNELKCDEIHVTSKLFRALLTRYDVKFILKDRKSVQYSKYPFLVVITHFEYLLRVANTHLNLTLSLSIYICMVKKVS